MRGHRVGAVRAAWVPVAVSAAALSSIVLLSCAGKPAAPDRATPERPVVQPPRFEPAPVPDGTPAAAGQGRSPYASMRGAIFTAAWTTVRDKHYDPALGGIDWNAARARYQPLALGAPDEPTFYRVMNDMLGELRQSHLFITGPGDEDPGLPSGPADGAEAAGTGPDPASAPGRSSAAPTGDPGLLVRSIGGRPIVARVRAGSSAATAGLEPGFVVTHIGGRTLIALKPRHPLRPIEERFYLRRTADQQLAGPVGTSVTVRFLDNNDRPGQVVLRRDPPHGEMIKFGNLPPLFPEVTIDQKGDVGIIAFNFFLMGPALDRINGAIEGFRTRKARSIIFDLRGNPGGMGAMAVPIAARLCERETPLGSLKFRNHENVLVARPSLDVKPFTGTVIILTDEGSASTSEIFAAGLQEAGRALVVGDMTLGAALPSAVEELPAGAIMQYVVADFRTPRGVLLESRGVIPDRRVVETRATLASGRDLVMDTAIALARAPQKRR